MQGLIIDYAGVLDTGAEDEKRWKTLIAAVKERDIAVGILSNEEGDGEAAEKIREWEFNGVVDAVVLSGEIGVEKPERAAFQAAADAVGVDLNECVMIDDDIMNVRAAVEIQSLFDIEGEF